MGMRAPGRGATKRSSPMRVSLAPKRTAPARPMRSGAGEERPSLEEQVTSCGGHEPGDGWARTSPWPLRGDPHRKCEGGDGLGDQAEGREPDGEADEEGDRGDEGEAEERWPQ